MVFLTTFLVLFITLVFMLYLYFKWLYTYWSRRGVITPKITFPLGNLNDVALGRVPLQEIFKNMYTNLKPKGIKYFGYYFIHKPVLVVMDLELIKAIMVKDFSNFTDHGLFEKHDYDSFGGNLFSLKGAEWKSMREKLTPLFSTGKLKLMFPTIENCAIELASLLDHSEKNCDKLDIEDIAARYATDIIASVAFGIESNSLKDPNSEFQKYGKRATGHGGAMNELRLAMVLFMSDFVSILKIPIFPTDVTDFFFEIVQKTVKYREENNIVRKDFMQLMIQLKNYATISDKNDDCFNLELKSNSRNIENKMDPLSIEQIVAQAVIFFLGGYDTSSATLAFCMYELAFQQDIQEKLRDEIRTVLNKHEGKLSYNAVMEFTYMDKCIKETLRKYPILSNLFRQCTKTYRTPNSDFIIEKDTIVFIPVNELHYDSEYYTNPQQFDPERFSSENLSARKPFTWLPFGEGPRVCIGSRLAMIQVKVALATFLNDFRYTLDSKTAYPLKRAPRSVVIAAEERIWLNIEKLIK